MISKNHQVPHLLDARIGDGRSGSDGYNDGKDTDTDKSLEKEVLVQEDECHYKERYVRYVVGYIDLDPRDDGDDVTNPHETTCGDSLWIDEETEPNRIEEYP